MGFVDFVRDAGLSDCGVFVCGLESCVCTQSADRVTIVDRVDPENDFERTDRVETLAGVNGEEAPEARERLDGRSGLLSLRGRLLSKESESDATEIGTSEATKLDDPEAYRGQQ